MSKGYVTSAKVIQAHTSSVKDALRRVAERLDEMSRAAAGVKVRRRFGHRTSKSSLWIVFFLRELLHWRTSEIIIGVSNGEPNMRTVRLFLRARAVIKYVLRAASTLKNTDGEQLTLRKFSRRNLDLSLLRNVLRQVIWPLTPFKQFQQLAMMSNYVR